METTYSPQLAKLGLKIGDGKLKIFVQDNTGKKPLLKEIPKPVAVEPVVVEEPVTKTKEWKKMTARKYVLDILYDNPMDTIDIARQYIKDGHSKKPLKKVQATIAVTISVLRKEKYPIVKIKAGRYGIRKDK